MDVWMCIMHTQPRITLVWGWMVHAFSCQFLTRVDFIQNPIVGCLKREKYLTFMNVYLLLR